MSDFVPVGQEGTFLGHVGGMSWREEADGVRARLTLGPHHTNPNGTAHGGLILTLLDFGLGVAAETALADDLEGHPITIQLSTSMIGAARQGETIEVAAHVDASTRTMSFVSGTILCDSRVVATASAVYRNPRPAVATK